MSEVRGRSSGALARQLGRLYSSGSAIGIGEAELIERYVFDRDEAAFEILVERHAPMVRRVCRRLLNDPNDVEDAVQATFLILVRKAGLVRRRELLANWLYGVACRVSARARENANQRGSRLARLANTSGKEAKASTLADATSEPVIDDQWVIWLHEEIRRLPQKYQTPVILCYFEGLTHDEAAGRLKWPIGTVKGRLSRAREVLRKRLLRRGVALSGAVIEACLVNADAGTAISVPLATVVMGSGVSSSVVSLAQGVSQAMILSQVKAAALPFVVMGAVASGIVLAASQGQGGKDEHVTDRVATAKPAADANRKSNTDGMSTAQKALLLSSPGLTAEKLGTIQPMYALLVNSKEHLNAEDYLQLISWSSNIKDAGANGVGDEERKMVLEAHRDRLRMLKERLISTGESDLILPRELGSLAPTKHGSDKISVTSAALEDVERELSAMARKTASLGWLAKAAKEDAPNAANSRALGRTPPVRSPAESKVARNGIDTRTAASANQAGGRPGSFGRPLPFTATPAQGRAWIAGLSAAISARQNNENSQEILSKLDEPVTVSFPDKTPLDEILRHVGSKHLVGRKGKMPVFIDPAGLEAVGVTLGSPVSIDLVGVPLKTSLRLILKQLNLAYCVRDGVLIISDVNGILNELQEAASEMDDQNFPRTGPIPGIIGGGAMGGMGGMM